MEDTMMRFDNDNLSVNFLTKEQLKSKCPYAFLNAPTNPNVSDRYIQANTSTVIDDLEKLGWYPVEAKQCRNRRNSSGIRSFHMISFQNPNVKISKPNNDGTETVDSYPRIILTNGHDGFNAFKFRVGLFRLVCSNGLVVASEQFANFSIKHINYDFNSLREIVKKTIDEVPNIVCTMNEMRNTEISEDGKRHLAKTVIRLRRGKLQNDEQFSYDDFAIQSILTPLRDSDRGNDLWTVYNVCQEKLIKGGFFGCNSRKRHRKQRPITSIKKDIELNQLLWQEAVSLM